MATNNVTLIGNLVEDPELRFTPSGVAMAKIRIAVNRRWRDQGGEWQEPDWMPADPEFRGYGSRCCGRSR